MTRPRAFTLIEMLVAAVLTAVLLGGVMTVSSALARDARRTSNRMTDTGAIDAAFDLIRWDLTNASSGADGLALTGHGGLNRATLRPDGRLARVVYRIRAGAGLVREQRYLDDPARPEPWSDLVLAGATEIESFTGDGASAGTTVRIRLRGGSSIRRKLVP